MYRLKGEQLVNEILIFVFFFNNNGLHLQEFYHIVVRFYYILLKMFHQKLKHESVRAVYRIAGHIRTLQDVAQQFYANKTQFSNLSLKPSKR